MRKSQCSDQDGSGEQLVRHKGLGEKEELLEELEDHSLDTDRSMGVKKRSMGWGGESFPTFLKEVDDRDALLSKGRAGVCVEALKRLGKNFGFFLLFYSTSSCYSCQHCYKAHLRM